uniref:Uncharacterized protein n=1 Tax=Parascaris univalens TaxID=6257 RepID=A0A915ATF5_PARUN
SQQSCVEYSKLVTSAVAAISSQLPFLSIGRRNGGLQKHSIGHSGSLRRIIRYEFERKRFFFANCRSAFDDQGTTFTERRTSRGILARLVKFTSLLFFL